MDATRLQSGPKRAKKQTNTEEHLGDVIKRPVSGVLEAEKSQGGRRGGRAVREGEREREK